MIGHAVDSIFRWAGGQAGRWDVQTYLHRGQFLHAEYEHFVSQALLLVSHQPGHAAGGTVVVVVVVIVVVVILGALLQLEFQQLIALQVSCLHCCIATRRSTTPQPR